jgi:hypothetical protein
MTAGRRVCGLNRRSRQRHQGPLPPRPPRSRPLRQGQVLRQAKPPVIAGKHRPSLPQSAPASCSVLPAMRSQRPPRAIQAPSAVQPPDSPLSWIRVPSAPFRPRRCFLPHPPCNVPSAAQRSWLPASGTLNCSEVTSPSPTCKGPPCHHSPLLSRPVGPPPAIPSPPFLLSGGNRCAEPCRLCRQPPQAGPAFRRPGWCTYPPVAFAHPPPCPWCFRAMAASTSLAGPMIPPCSRR